MGLMKWIQIYNLENPANKIKPRKNEFEETILTRTQLAKLDKGFRRCLNV